MQDFKSVIFDSQVANLSQEELDDNVVETSDEFPIAIVFPSTIISNSITGQIIEVLVTDVSDGVTIYPHDISISFDSDNNRVVADNSFENSLGVVFKSTGDNSYNIFFVINIINVVDRSGSLIEKNITFNKVTNGTFTNAVFGGSKKRYQNIFDNSLIWLKDNITEIEDRLSILSRSLSSNDNFAKIVNDSTKSKNEVKDFISIVDNDIKNENINSNDATLNKIIDNKNKVLNIENTINDPVISAALRDKLTTIANKLSPTKNKEPLSNDFSQVSSNSEISGILSDLIRPPLPSLVPLGTSLFYTSLINKTMKDIKESNKVFDINSDELSDLKNSKQNKNTTLENTKQIEESSYNILLDTKRKFENGQATEVEVKTAETNYNSSINNTNTAKNETINADKSIQDEMMRRNDIQAIKSLLLKVKAATKNNVELLQQAKPDFSLTIVPIGSPPVPTLGVIQGITKLN